ncbi:MAG TPA: 2-succinyl-5-enolpyruvyl-6-hydroxy-3-cyclohexene-1-carboxylic-acid synthase [Acidimicrobiia bacterium]|nr:2-succinyl-5-enolpyruvyl-6-hydroxy-3-cyclohexene-1-carboxylic-acid synthase [Acidimicrobiia bacterium]
MLVDELVRHGLRRAVLTPGSRSAALAYALAANPAVELHVALDERSAGFFALGVGKAGELAAVVTTSGTATANLYPAVIEADAAANPLLLLTADRPPEMRQIGANQTIDQVHLYGNRVRWFAELGPAENLAGEVAGWRSIISQAAAASLGATGRPGPAHLNVAFREPVVPVSDDGRTIAEGYSHPLEGRAGDRPWSDWDAPWEEGFEIEVEGRVLVVLGEGATPDLAVSALQAGCVVIAEAHSGTRVPGTISTAHHLLAGRRFRDSVMPTSVVQMGRVGLSRNLAGLLETVDNRTVIASHSWPGPGQSVAAVGGPMQIVDKGVDRSWADRWQEADSVARRTLDQVIDATEVLDEARTARDLAALIPSGGTLVVGSSMPVRDLDWFMAPRSGLRVLANRGASGIDGFVSTALGVAASDQSVVALSGDLGLIHDQNGWLTSPRSDLTMVVVNNDGGGIFSFLPQASFPSHFEQLFGTPHGLDLATLARLYGLDYQVVSTATDLATQLEARTGAGTHLLEVRTNREENVARHRHLTSLVVNALDQSL